MMAMKHIQAGMSLAVVGLFVSFLTAGIADAQTAVTCSAQGGYCANFCSSGEESIGSMDCPAPEACCRLSAVSPAKPGATVSGQTGSADAPSGQVLERLELPPCTKTGNCSVADIVQTGVDFARFLMGLSAALFFVVFIYGGAMYLLSFGDAGRVKKGQEAIKGAVIGMIFVLGAWTIVQTLVKGIGAPAVGGPATANTCPAQGAGYSCVPLTGSTPQEAVADGKSKGFSCKTGLCPGPVNVLCCKSQ